MLVSGFAAGEAYKVVAAQLRASLHQRTELAGPGAWIGEIAAHLDQFSHMTAFPDNKIPCGEKLGPPVTDRVDTDGAADPEGRTACKYCSHRC